MRAIMCPVKPPSARGARDRSPIDAVPASYHISAMIDWSKCPDAESVPDRCSGAWVVKRTRIPVQAILDNAEDCTPEEIAGPDIYPDLPLDLVRRVLAFAAAGRPADT